MGTQVGNIPYAESPDHEVLVSRAQGIKAYSFTIG